MTSPLTNLGLRIPVIAAPMAGGATTPAMVIAAISGRRIRPQGSNTPAAIGRASEL